LNRRTNSAEIGTGIRRLHATDAIIERQRWALARALSQHYNPFPETDIFTIRPFSRPQRAVALGRNADLGNCYQRVPGKSAMELTCRRMDERLSGRRAIHKSLQFTHMHATSSETESPASVW
jgi:hypothetical protein